MAGCPKCGNEETQWSEFEKHLWCEKCQVDFIPKHAGIFDGPILVRVCELLGIYFDRVNIITGLFERFAPDAEWHEGWVPMIDADFLATPINNLPIL